MGLPDGAGRFRFESVAPNLCVRSMLQAVHRFRVVAPNSQGGSGRRRCSPRAAAVGFTGPGKR
jgi:hypothetical protein